MGSQQRAHHPAGPVAGRAEGIRLPTDLTVTRVQDSFASPDTLSVWCCRISSRYWTVPDFHRSGTACISILCWRCLCCARRWRWSRRLLDAADPARRRRQDDRRRRVGRLHAVRDLQGRRRIRPVRRPSRYLAAWAPAHPGSCWRWRCCCTRKTVEHETDNPPPSARAMARRFLMDSVRWADPHRHQHKAGEGAHLPPHVIPGAQTSSPGPRTSSSGSTRGSARPGTLSDF